MPASRLLPKYRFNSLTDPTRFWISVFHLEYSLCHFWGECTSVPLPSVIELLLHSNSDATSSTHGLTLAVLMPNLLDRVVWLRIYLSLSWVMIDDFSFCRLKSQLKNKIVQFGCCSQFLFGFASLSKFLWNLRICQGAFRRWAWKISQNRGPYRDILQVESQPRAGLVSSIVLPFTH